MNRKGQAGNIHGLGSGGSTRSLKGISPLIATLILIAITIVGGVVVYRLFFSSTTSISSSVHVVITDVTLSNSAGLIMTIKNDGNIQLSSISVSVSGVAASTISPSTSASWVPGASLVITGTPSSPFTIGTTLNVRVTVSGVGGGSFTTSVSALGVA